MVNNPSRVVQQYFEIKWFQWRRPLPPDRVLVEIGCGRGAGGRLLKRAFQPRTLHIMDVDVGMMRMAARYLNRGEKERIGLVAGDAVDLPFQSDSVDAVIGFGFLHHVPDWRTALAEVHRVLRPGGIYYIEELYPTLYQNFITRHILLHPTHDRFKSRDLKAALDGFGLQLRHTFEIKLAGILGVAEKE